MPTVEPDDLEIRSKIRTRLFAMERTFTRHLGEKRARELKDEVHRRLETDNNPEKSGIPRPAISTRDLYRED